MSNEATTLEVLFTPADFACLKQRDLGRTTCVVFDVLRATSSMVTALANGAESIVPVEDIPEALKKWKMDPEVLLAGERNGLRITSQLTGGGDFHLGNSPREFTRDRVEGRKLVMTTTNGTRALSACDGAERVLVASFLNLKAVAKEVAGHKPGYLTIVCSGTFEEAALEDVLGAGALCELIWKDYESGKLVDSAIIARDAWLREKDDIAAGFGKGRNGQRLLSRPDLREDVAFCARRDAFPVVAEMKNGTVRLVQN